MRSSLISDFSCLDKVTQEFSCSICLELFFEPCTISCGHSFCKKCLRSSICMSRRRRCPLCRKYISKGEKFNLNIVLWDTIQVLYPKEVEARKATIDSKGSTNFSAQPRESEDFDPVIYQIISVGVGLGMTLPIIFVCACASLLKDF